jgi:uncharacterized protein
MENPEKRIVEFIKKHHVLTLATVSNNIPWCANCFYAYMEDENSFVFTSDFKTRHIEEALVQNQVAGSVVLETNIVGKIQGIQFSGILNYPDEDQYITAEKTYVKRFPFAALMETTLWILRIDYLKMTDNRLGFGKKITWQREL